MSTSEAMMNELRTDLCELGFMELIDYVHEFLPQTAANIIAIKQLNRMWRFIAMMAAHWEGSILCKRECGKHMLLNPTKLQKPNAEKDAWCCNPYNCRDFCTCKIPKSLKNDDELQDQRIGGYPAFEFLGIDFAVCHEIEVEYDVVSILKQRQPNIDNVYFDSWPQDNVVAIRFMQECRRNNSEGINNKLLERFGPRNLRLFVATSAPISPTSLEKCGKLKWLDLCNPCAHVNKETMSAIVKLPQLKRLSLDYCYNIPQECFKLLRDNKSVEMLSLRWIANDAIVEELSQMKCLVSIDLTDNSISAATIMSLVANGTRLEILNVRRCGSTIGNISTLRSLDVVGCDVTDSVLVEIATKPCQLEVLKLNSFDLHDSGFAALGGLISMRSLSVGGVSDTVSPDVINATLGNLTQLRVLDLNSSGVKSEHLQFLEKLRNLEVLSLAACRNVDDEGLSHVRHLSKLRKLNLCNCNRVTSDGVAHLSQLTEMESLDLSYHTNIDDKALQHISGMTKMRWLKLRECVNITDEGLQFLRDMRELELLSLKDCKKVTTPTVIRCVEGMNKLKFLCQSCDEDGDVAIRERYPDVLVV